MKTILKTAILTLLTAIQAVPTHAMLSQAARRLVAGRNIAGQRIAQNHKKISPVAALRTYASQGNTQHEKDNKYQENQSGSQQSWWQRWRNTIFKSSLATSIGAASRYAYADEKNYFDVAPPAPETSEASRVCYSREEEDSEKPSDSNVSEFEKFVHQFTPPEEIQRTIEANKKQIASILNKKEGRHIAIGVVLGSPHDDTPNIVIKGNDISRIINAERIRTCIEKYNLNKLAVPKKYIYKCDDIRIVIAEHVEIDDTHRIFTLEEIQQLVKLTKKIGYVDWDDSNIIIDKNTNRVTFIDTEDCSFDLLDPSFSSRDRLIRLDNYLNFRGLIDNDTQLWLDHYLYGSPQRERFDNPNLDFEKVKEEWRNKK